MGSSSGPRLIPLPVMADERGSLAVAELGGGLPFVVRRFFIISGTGLRRGGHAHRRQHQMLVCVCGSTFVQTSFQETRESFVIWRPSDALYAPPLTWLDLDLEDGSRLLVLSSDGYDEADYVRDRLEFERL